MNGLQINPAADGNPWTLVAKHLRTDGEGVATFQGKALITSRGKCRAKVNKNGPIS